MKDFSKSVKCICWLKSQSVIKVKGKLSAVKDNSDIMQLIIIIIWQGKSKHLDWLFLGQNFAIWTSAVQCLLSKASKCKTNMA